MARLILNFKDKVLDVYSLESGQAVTIGRHQDNCIVVDNLAVSGQHARIDWSDEAVTVSDLQSKNGTFVNDVRVSEAVLAHNDTIVVGKHTLLVDLDDSIDVEPSADYASHGQWDNPSPMSEANTMFLDTSEGRQQRGEEAPPPPPPEPEYAEHDNLIFLDGGQGELSLSRKEITIGRDDSDDIVIGGFWRLLAGNPAATISTQAGDYFLRFAGGLVKPKRNGTGVKGTIKLNHDDILQIGSLRLKVQLRKRSDTA